MTDYEKLKSIVDGIDILIQKKVSASDADFEAWYIKAERFLIKVFGNGSIEHERFKDISFSLMLFTLNTPQSDFVKACISGLQTARAVFATYLEEMQETSVTLIEEVARRSSDFEKIFIVHGHNGELKESLARMIEKQKLKPIILNEQANKGKTIIEKMEENSDVSAAICLFTADDFGYAKSEEKEQPRARQNVVFEAGYFMGKLGRDKVIIIAESGVEMPSDMQGIVYTNESNWQFELLKELKAIGYNIDFNKLI